jgi:hypothetical protein
MTVAKDEAVRQLAAAHHAYNDARSRSQYDDLSDLETAEISRLITLLAAAVERLAPPGSRYRMQVVDILARAGGHNAVTLPVLLGVILALRADYEAGYLLSFQELVHAEVFADFLEMASYLNSEGYKDPAAVLVGGVLEDHLRQLCRKNNVPIDQNGKARKADALNSDLAKNGVYPVLDQKNVTAWLDLRNKAAHGKYIEYTKDQVALMIQAVQHFLTRHPA